MLSQNFRVCNGRLFSGAGLPPLRDSEPIIGKKFLESNSLFNSTSPSGFRPKIQSAYPSSTHVTDSETPANESRRSRRVWTNAEDARLAYAISLHSAKRSKPWRKIAYVVSSRNSKQCRYRWSQTLTMRSNKIQSRLPVSAAINASTPFSKCTVNDSADLFSAFGCAIGGDAASVGLKQQHFSQRKRRLDFGDDAVSDSSEDLDTIDVEDFVTTVDRRKNKFNVLVVDKVKTLSTSKKVRIRIGANMGESGFACKKFAMINMKLAGMRG